MSTFRTVVTELRRFIACLCLADDGTGRTPPSDGTDGGEENGGAPPYARQVIQALGDDDPDFIHGLNKPGGVDDADTWLATVAAIAPIAICVVLIATYYLTGDNFRSYAAGGAFTALCLLILLTIYWRGGFREASHASVDFYNDLCQRMQRMSRLRGFVPDETVTDPDAVALRDAMLDACSDVRHYALAFDQDRQKCGLHWILSKGYLGLLDLVHRAEEAALLYAPPDVLLVEGLGDDARLAGSTIPNHTELMNQVRRALLEISPNMTHYFAQTPATAPPATSGGGARAIPPLPREVQVRAVLRNVRFVINDFRDIRRRQLVQARNILLYTLFMSGLAIVLLLVFLLLLHPVKNILLAGAILYAVGAGIGMFNRLYNDFSTSGIGSDYGITITRLFQTTLLSGLAAVVGVYIAVTLPVALNDPVLSEELSGIVSPTPAAATTATATGGATGTASVSRASGAPIVTVSLTRAPAKSPTAQPTLSSTPVVVQPAVHVPEPVEVYDLSRYPFDIVLAAIFGLTPGLLVQRLTQYVNQSKSDLKNSQPSADRNIES